MREDCKHYQSRTYAGGETVRKCNLDLAPEAPWRCPENCSAYEIRLADVNWTHASLVSPPAPPEPPEFDSDDVGALLDEAEDIVNQAVPEIMAEVEKEQGADRPSLWQRIRRRR